VGTVGVLLYLAGLANIGQDIYEAAEIDGIGSVGKLFFIELPLILGQVRINLIFLTIGTLTDYGLFLLLLGSQGGPGGVGMVPGLYMYRTAFVDGEFGYACALGIVLAAIILVITVLYQRYVSIEK
jgi:ABC-type sugar transport system permease subunit